MVKEYLIWGLEQIIGIEAANYLILGLEHILDIHAYDHLLFIMVLCAGFTLKNWKGIIWLATAFTIGHSITLAIVTLDLVSVNSTLVELLIPITIIVSAMIDLSERYLKWHFGAVTKYLLVGAFGLIHGSGFSGYLKSLLFGEDSIITPLLSFNIGVELAQISIILLVFAIAFILWKAIKIPFHKYRHIISITGIVVSIWMLIERV